MLLHFSKLKRSGTAHGARSSLNHTMLHEKLQIWDEKIVILKIYFYPAECSAGGLFSKKVFNKNFH